jgi:uncharacterized glyoxalase superfamily protein PhnB
MEDLTLTVKSVERSTKYYKSIGFDCEWNAAPHFAMMRMGGKAGPTLGLLAWSEAKKEGAKKTTAKHNRSIHVELSTGNLDLLYTELKKKGLKFAIPPHDEPWERSATAYDPDGYSVEFSQGRRGKKPKKK